MDFQEEELAMSMSSIADTKFDATIGHIEDMIMGKGVITMKIGATSYNLKSTVCT